MTSRPLADVALAAVGALAGCYLVWYGAVGYAPAGGFQGSVSTVERLAPLFGAFLAVVAAGHVVVPPETRTGRVATAALVAGGALVALYAAVGGFA